MKNTKKMSLITGILVFTLVCGCSGSGRIGNSASRISDTGIVSVVSESASQQTSEISSEEEKQKYSATLDNNSIGLVDFYLSYNGQQVDEVPEDDEYSVTIISKNSDEYTIKTVSVNGVNVFTAQDNAFCSQKTIDGLVMTEGGAVISVGTVGMGTLTLQSGISDKVELTLTYDGQAVEKVEEGLTYSAILTCIDSDYGIVSVSIGGEKVFTATENGNSSSVVVQNLTMSAEGALVEVQFVRIYSANLVCSPDYSQYITCELKCDGNVVSGVEEGKLYSVKITSIRPFNYTIESISINGEIVYSTPGEGNTITKTIDNLVMAQGVNILVNLTVTSDLV